MKKWILRIAFGIFSFFVVAGLVYHLGLRNWCLHWGTTAAEAHATLPGDDLFPVYSGEATHAITIHASPQQIGPWLMQIGQDRSGFYSYTFRENAIGADMPKGERLVPEVEARAVGKRFGSVIPSASTGQARMIAAVVDPGRTFVMAMPNEGWAPRPRRILELYSRWETETPG